MAGLGHPGFGFAAKLLAPKVHLIVLLMASELIDIFGKCFTLQATFSKTSV